MAGAALAAVEGTRAFSPGGNPCRATAAAGRPRDLEGLWKVLRRGGPAALAAAADAAVHDEFVAQEDYLTLYPRLLLIPGAEML